MNTLPTVYQQFIHLSRYARWLPEKGKRETWEETVKRYFDFFEAHLKENYKFKLTKELRSELENAILNLEIMPSMRCLMSAGPALERENLAGYNCAYIAIDSPRAFDETLYVLMNGTGVGFSVERQYITKLPVVAEDFFETDTTIIVADSKIGWAKSLKELIGLLYLGQIPKWDLSKVRPAGSPLKTFGGRSSGPEPLNELFNFCVNIFKNASGRKLQSLECHDILCKIAEVVIVGGVRRSALLSLSNVSDDRMRTAKSGNWWELHPHRALANNSACYTETPDMGIFMSEWKALYDSKSGERGIFNRVSATNQAKKTERREYEEKEFGVNPCSEIIIRSKELCNLSEVVCRENDSVDHLKRKVRLATILGTFQSSLTFFKYVSKEWKINCEEERLLGVSLTGMMDCYALNDITKHTENLSILKNIAIETNKEFAKKLVINQAASITCVKPSGTVSQLVDSASGLHARHSRYYIRTVRMDRRDPMTQMMIDLGFPHEVDYMKNNQMVFSFPIKTPDGSIIRKDVSAFQQLEFWLSVQDNWCEHKPSVTISVKEHEWMKVGAFVYEHFENISGISFLPYSEHSYKQAPYQECTREEYEKFLDKIPRGVDWSNLSNYEKQDNTIGSQELSCGGNSCEI